MHRYVSFLYNTISNEYYDPRKKERDIEKERERERENE